LFLIECKNAAASIDAMRILEYSENIKQLLCKLPYHLHDRWRSIVLGAVQFSSLCGFLQYEHSNYSFPGGVYRSVAQAFPCRIPLL
jgi:hypothetical protein